jgi:hypothetical protein
MVEVRSEPHWRGVVENRSCGSCYACCVWLGIEELQKWTGQKCQHLKGPASGNKRCKIYTHRPHACSGYRCMWLQGYGPDMLRPSRSGVLLTGYDSERKPGSVAITAIVFDIEKAKPILDDLIKELISLPDVEVRLVNWKEKTGMLFFEGKIYDCRLLPPSNFESLNFEAAEPPIGKYRVQIEREADASVVN